VPFSCPLCASHSLTDYFKDQRRDYFQCAVCQLVFVHPEQRLNAEQEKAEYDLHCNSPNDDDYRIFLARLAQPMLAQLPANSCGLDFGCGPGPTLSTMFEQAGMTVVLYDKFYYNDKTVLQQQYDFISATEVAEHLFQPGAMLTQLWQKISPGGMLGLMTKLLIDRQAFAQWHYKNDLTHVVFFSRHSFEWLAQALSAKLEFIGSDVIILHKPT
jgi:2-polyprenyl-3-methyl-5-hydroxy-6-metoxy-1,4-benzoquinol methylase